MEHEHFEAWPPEKNLLTKNVQGFGIVIWLKKISHSNPGQKRIPIH